MKRTKKETYEQLSSDLRRVMSVWTAEQVIEYKARLREMLDEGDESSGRAARAIVIFEMLDCLPDSSEFSLCHLEVDVVDSVSSKGCK